MYSAFVAFHKLWQHEHIKSPAHAQTSQQTFKENQIIIICNVF